MHNNNHTPGPWAPAIDRDGFDNRLDDVRVLAIERDPHPQGPLTIAIANQNLEEAAANARLIAAAPAMLEALHGLKKCAAITAERLDIDSSAAIWAWISEAQDALMQATGGRDQ
jgi:hypothetical protein